MIKKTWALALYNVKRTYGNLEDLQNMFEVAETIDSAYSDYEKIDLIKKWLLSIGMLNDDNINKLIIDPVLITHLNKIETFLSSFASNFDDRFLSDTIDRIIASGGKFIVSLDDKDINYVQDDDKQFNKSDFIDTVNEMKQEVSLKTVLEFIYKNGFEKVNYELITGNSTNYNNIAVVIPILECLTNPKLETKFSNYQLAEFYNAFANPDAKKDVDYLKDVIKSNNDYVKIDNSVVSRFEDAVKNIKSNFDIPDDFLINKVGEKISLEDLNNISPELVKIYKNYGITFDNLEDCYKDYIGAQTGQKTKFSMIKNTNDKNEIVKLLTGLVEKLIMQYVNFTVKQNEDIKTFNETYKNMRVKTAGDKLMTNVIEKWQNFIAEMKKNDAFKGKLKELEEDFKNIMTSFDDDKFVYKCIRKNIDYIELISKVDTFKLHFFDDMTEFMTDEAKKMPKHSIEMKLTCEKEVLHILSVLFSVPFDVKSEFKTYSQCALIVYGLVKI